MLILFHYFYLFFYLIFLGNPNESPDSTSDPYKTLFVARIVSMLYILDFFIYFMIVT